MKNPMCKCKQSGKKEKGKIIMVPSKQSLILLVKSGFLMLIVAKCMFVVWGDSCLRGQIKRTSVLNGKIIKGVG
jgi:hypothetical protein